MATFMRSPISQNTTDPSTSRAHDCRWAWCRLSFADNAALIRHVIEDHVRNARSVPRKDIPVIRRAEEGIGESLSLTGVFDGAYSTSNQSAKTVSKQDIEAPQSYQPRATTPTFTSLSSPADSPGSLHVPDSPPFHILVENAPYTKPAVPSIHSPNAHFQHHSQDSQSSIESSGSRASVILQLTQSVDNSSGIQSPNNQNHEDGIDVRALADSSPSWDPVVYHEEPARSSTEVPTPLEEPTMSVVSDPQTSPPSPMQSPIRPPSTPFTKSTIQTWYQAIPPLRKRSRTVLDRDGNSALARKRNVTEGDAPDSPSHGRESPPKIFSSGRLQIQLTPPHPSSLLEDAREQSQSQDAWSQSLSQVPSYQILQTQAPYQSQSQG
ncbi:hypothetical protein BD779DRAFT_1796320 [Infundibulicybe gibba]|nr:hypothetical protein BD779DRAFT_1796320 [Infundibulicybe gibba]